MFVASNKPPTPTSKTTTSHSYCSKCKNAIMVVISKNVRESESAVET